MILSFLKKNYKRIFIIMFVIILLVFIVFKLLSAYSYSYNNWLAEREFNKMCKYIKDSEIDRIDLYVYLNSIDGINSAPIDINQINNINRLSESLTYSGLSAPETSPPCDGHDFIGFEIDFHDGPTISFGTTNSIDFHVINNHNPEKTFYVRSSVLTEFICSDTFSQLKNDWDSLL